MIAFTLCSNNYLPMARALGESFLRQSPDSRFIIGLVDLLDREVDYVSFRPLEILPVSELGIVDFDDMVLRYSIVELNTAVKPFYFRFLFEKYSAQKDLKICYFDPDTCIYSSL